LAQTSKERVQELAEPLAGEIGLEVLDVEVAGTPGSPVFKIFLDCPDRKRPVTVADCATVSRRLGDVLDADDAADGQGEGAGRYVLEVSSPGLNRRLVRPEHFLRVVGERVKVKTVSSVDGRNNFVGVLEGFKDGRLAMILDDGTSVNVALSDLERANYQFQFEEKKRPGGKRR
jgi:ribosome maturation factor RimP